MKSTVIIVLLYFQLCVWSNYKWNMWSALSEKSIEVKGRSIQAIKREWKSMKKEHEERNAKEMKDEEQHLSKKYEEMKSSLGLKVCVMLHSCY